MLDHSDFDKSFKRTQRTVWGMFAFVVLLKIALVVLAIFFGMKACSAIEREGGLGKAIGSFIGDVQSGAKEPTDD